MIKNPSYAIVWSMVKGQRLSMVALLTSIPLILIIKQLLITFLPPELHLSSGKLYPMLLVQLSILMVVLFTFTEYKGKFAKSAFPKNTFVHPISSTQLAMVPLLFGIFITFIYYICWFVFVVNYQFELRQILILFCCVSAGVSWTQVMSWRFNDAMYLGIIVMISMLVIISVLFVSSWGTDNFTPLIDEKLAYLGLFFLPVSGIVLAVNSVGRCRTNENVLKKFYLSNIRFFGFNLPKIYQSHSQALFRYEWRVFGWLLPMPGILIASSLILFVNSIGINDKLMDAIGLIGFTLIYLPWFFPAEMSKSDLSTTSKKTSGISSFIASLPVSNFELAMAKLKLAIGSIGLFQLTVLLIINIILILAGDRIITNPWVLLETRFGPLGAGVILCGVNLLFPIIAWILGGNTLAWCLKGERFFKARRIVIILFSLGVILVLGFRFYTTESFRMILLDYSSVINVLVFVSIAVVFYRALSRFQSFESLSVIKLVLRTAVALWVFELLVFATLGMISLSNLNGVLILLDLLLLGLLPFLNSPFSIAKNRAR
jgi:hypothetical protein